MPRFRIRRFNQAKVERAFRAREKGEQETTVKKPHGRLPWWLGGGVSASAGDTTRDPCLVLGRATRLGATKPMSHSYRACATPGD